MTGERTGDASVLTALFQHNTWANLRLLDFCAGLSDEQLRSTAVGTYGSIRGTFAHIVGGECDYVQRVTGELSPAAAALMAEVGPDGKFPGFQVLKDAARWSGEELLRLALGARAEDVVRETFPEEHAAVEYPLSAMLLQAINHGTEHRAQIAAILTGLGMEPPPMDGWTWIEERGEFREYRTE